MTLDTSIENIEKLVHPDDLDEYVKANEHAIKGGKRYDFKFRLLLSDNSIKWVHERGSFEFDKDGKATVFEGTSQDITIQEQQREKLLDSLKEKDILLAEIHHRVKNNLAVVSGLLELQKNSLSGSEVHKALTDSQLRIKSMAIIHEQLYQAQRFSRIWLREILEALIPEVRAVYANSDRIDIQIECDQVQLNINQAVPCTLIINELLSNAFKHAFNENENGRIDLYIKKSGAMIDITVKDNGRGFEAEKFLDEINIDEINIDEINTMGYTIIKTLLKQIKAELSFESADGFQISFKFKKEEIKGSSSNMIDELP